MPPRVCFTTRRTEPCTGSLARTIVISSRGPQRSNTRDGESGSGFSRSTPEGRRILLEALEERVRRGQIGNGKAFAWAFAWALAESLSRGSRLGDENVPAIVTKSTAYEAWPLTTFWNGSPPFGRPCATLSAHSQRPRPHLFCQLENWCLPRRLSMVTKLSEETRGMVRRNGRAMLGDARRNNVEMGPSRFADRGRSAL